MVVLGSFGDPLVADGLHAKPVWGSRLRMAPLSPVDLTRGRPSPGTRCTPHVECWDVRTDRVGRWGQRRAEGAVKGARADSGTGGSTRRGPSWSAVRGGHSRNRQDGLAAGGLPAG